jgi:hypothetical protein
MPDYQPLHCYEHFNVRMWLPQIILQLTYFNVLQKQEESYVSDNT